MRNKRGQSLMELCCGSLVAIPILLALLDAGVLLIGAAAGDMLCRDAARAAASGPPGMLTAGDRLVGADGEPMKRAKTVLNRIYKLGIPVQVRESELRVRESLQNPMPSTSYGGGINGNVAVECTVDVMPPFILGVVQQHAIPMRSRHSMPYTYVLPATIASEP